MQLQHIPIAAHTKPLDFASEMRIFIGRHLDKRFDWDAFPGRGCFPELERAQTRYIGAGGSPKADDLNALKPGQFTLNLVHQSSANHSMKWSSSPSWLQGVLTVGWAWNAQVAQLGPKDVVLNKASEPHCGSATMGRSRCWCRPALARACRSRPGLCLPPARHRSVSSPSGRGALHSTRSAGCTIFAAMA